MKLLKLFFVMAFCAVAFNMNAVTKATITITSDAHPTYYDYIDIEMDATYAVDFTNSSKKIHSTMSGGTVEVYAEGTTQDYCIIKMKDVNGVKLVFKANTADDNYTMSFSNVSENCPIKVKKGTDGTPFEMTANYQFSCTKSTSCEFYLVTPQSHDRAVTNGNWGTFCYEEAISSVEGATVYEFKGKDATRVQVGTVTFPLTAGKAYVFNATADAQKFFYTDATKATQVTANNGLIGKFTEYTTTTDDADAYVIKGTSLVPAAVGSTIPANRAYVQKLSDIQGSITSAPGRKIFNIVNTPTSVDMLEAAPAMDGKMIINGQLIIMKGGKMFNAQGAAL